MFRNEQHISVRRRHPLLQLIPASVLVALLGFSAPGQANDATLSYDPENYSRFLPLTALDLLRQLPTTGMGKNLNIEDDVLLYGMSGSYQSLSINGQPLLGDSNAQRLALERIPAAMIKQIDISENSQSDQDWGGGAAGAINLILKDQFSPSSYLAGISGPEDGYQLLADVSLSRTLRIGLSRIRQASNNQGTYDDGTRQTWSQHRQQQDDTLRLYHQASLSAATRLSSELMLMNSDFDRNHTALPLTLRYDASHPGLADTTYQHDRTNQYLRFSASHQIDSRITRLSLTGEQFEQQQQRDNTYDDEDDSRYRLNWTLAETRDEHRWSLGLSYQQRKQSTYHAGDSQQQQLIFKENRASAFIQDAWQVTPGTRLTLGLRLESYELSQDNEGDQSLADQSEIATATYWLPSAILNRRLDYHQQLQFSLGQSIHSARARDRVPHQLDDENLLWMGNANLVDEQITSYVMRYQRQFQTGVRAEEEGLILSVFQRSLYQPIHYRYDALAAGQYQITPVNSAVPAVLRGISLSVRRPLSLAERPLIVELGANLYESDVRGGQVIEQRRRLDQSPDAVIKASVEYWYFRHARLGAYWFYQGQSAHLAVGDTHEISVRNTPSHDCGGYLDYSWTGGWRIGVSISQHLTGDYRSNDPDFQLESASEWRWQLQLRKEG
ncbi:TonB-dependent receptor plug domain-containing protein [Candidatus Thalassolituus haligoni]|jgi:hypothetical protein|uniref:TonB-dependent receptor plug domain-containing protein n=1 Tax=Candidatus Thalassolituus haligoni TaxID=3100113 RepID=UPI003514FCA2|tara:strand:- start:97 stop:2103 length:2007 start_codon:yes stop_codon:yes gene_type:complete